jgi:hypothetical protein
MRRPIRLSALALSASASIALVGAFLPAGASADSTPLTGTTGPGYTISLQDAAGNAVAHLDPGTYTVVVHDLADVHNFHLSGPGVDQATSVEGTGDVTWTVTLKDGVYKFVCAQHAELMAGDFTVGTPPTTTTAAPKASTGKPPATSTTKKPVKKPVAKRVLPKKPVAKKKAVAKKPVAKKAAAKKAVARKPVPTK